MFSAELPDRIMPSSDRMTLLDTASQGCQHGTSCGFDEYNPDDFAEINAKLSEIKDIFNAKKIK